MKFNSDFIYGTCSTWHPYRVRGHPYLRWDDHVHAYCWNQWPEQDGSHWFDILKNENLASLEDSFISFMKVSDESSAEDID